MMTIVVEKEVFLVVGALDVFKKFVFQKWFTFFLSLSEQALSSIWNESGHFSSGEKGFDLAQTV